MIDDFENLSKGNKKLKEGNLDGAINYFHILRLFLICTIFGQKKFVSVFFLNYRFCFNYILAN